MCPGGAGAAGWATVTHARVPAPLQTGCVPPRGASGGGGSVSLPRTRSYLLPRLKRNESSSSVQNYFHLDSLQKKLKDLEEENVVLRSEVASAPCSCPLWGVAALFPLSDLLKGSLSEPPEPWLIPALGVASQGWGGPAGELCSVWRGEGGWQPVPLCRVEGDLSRVFSSSTGMTWSPV